MKEHLLHFHNDTPLLLITALVVCTFADLFAILHRHIHRHISLTFSRLTLCFLLHQLCIRRKTSKVSNLSRIYIHSLPTLMIVIYQQITAAFWTQYNRRTSLLCNESQVTAGFGEGTWGIPLGLRWFSKRGRPSGAGSVC